MEEELAQRIRRVMAAPGEVGIYGGGAGGGGAGGEGAGRGGAGGRFSISKGRRMTFWINKGNFLPSPPRKFPESAPEREDASILTFLLNLFKMDEAIKLHYWSFFSFFFYSI